MPKILSFRRTLPRCGRLGRTDTFVPVSRLISASEEEKKMLARFALACSALAAVASIALADDPFTLTAQNLSGPGASATATGNNLPDLVENLIDAQDEFRT